MKTVADGQMAATSTALYAAAGDVCANVSIENTSSSLTETVLLTVLRSGSTARRVCRAVLLPNEQLVVEGLALGSGDILKGSTTDATTVDYVVATTTGDIPFNIYTMSSAGVLKTAGSASSSTITGKQIAQLFETGPAPTDTYAAAMTIDVSYGYHKILGVNTTSATVTFTPSGVGSAGDMLTILTDADGTGTVTATFASTFHTTGASGTTQATTAGKFSSITFQSDGTIWRELCRVTAMG